MSYYLDDIGKYFKNMMIVISCIADLLTIAASCLAFYIFFAKGKVISKALKVLINYSMQISLSELTTKIERLVDLNASDNTQKPEVDNILNEIVGHITGNKMIKSHCESVLKKIESCIKNPDSLTEPRKRCLTSELRETLRTFHAHNFDDLLGGE